MNDLVYDKVYNNNTLFHKYATESKQQPTNSLTAGLKLDVDFVFLPVRLAENVRRLLSCWRMDMALSLTILFWYRARFRKWTGAHSYQFIFSSEEFDWSQTPSISLNHPILLMFFCRVQRVADETVQEVVRCMCLQNKGSAIGIDLTYPPFLCLICSYLPCHSALHTAPFKKMTLFLREPSTPSEPDCKNTKHQAENELCTRQWPQCLASRLLSCWEVCSTNSLKPIQTCWN